MPIMLQPKGKAKKIAQAILNSKAKKEHNQQNEVVSTTNEMILNENTLKER